MKESVKQFCRRAVVLVAALVAVSASAAEKKPNILIIWGDDVGYWNVSAYNQGMMGYRTPNIDRIAKGGRCSQTGTASIAAPPAGPVSLPGSRVSGPEC